jgi:hypothetical protein
MSRKTKKNHARKGTVWIPKTIKAGKKIGHRTVKRVRFLLKDVKQKVMKIPGYVDRVASRGLHYFSKKRKRTHRKH